MYNNDYSVFPVTPENGDTYQFRNRTYMYNQEYNAWIDAAIPVPVDYTQCTIEYKNPGDGMGTTIISRPDDITADLKYNAVVENKNAKLQEADIHINSLNEIDQLNEEQTKLLADIINYKEAIESIDNNAEPDTIEWPAVPWV